MNDPMFTKDRMEELFRDKLVSWMIQHDIATGPYQTFDELLEIVGTHIDGLKTQLMLVADHQ